MKRVLFLIFFCLVPLRVFAQDCTKGQSVTYGQLPDSPYNGTACLITDAANCTEKQPITGGGGPFTCKGAYYAPNWVASGNTAGGLTPTGVVPGTYNNTTVTFNQYGQALSASSGKGQIVTHNINSYSAPTGCTSVSGTSPIIDEWNGTLTGSLSPTLPAFSNCADGSQIWFQPVQSVSNFTFTPPSPIASVVGNTCPTLGSSAGNFVTLQFVDVVSLGGWVEYCGPSIPAPSPFLIAANNLSDVANAATSLTNLGGLKASNNLSDVANSTTSITNLGALKASNNLSDVSSAATSLTNLGGLKASNNLSDVANASTALTNLGGLAESLSNTSATNYGTSIAGPVSLLASAPYTGVIQVVIVNVQVTLGVGCSAGSNTALMTFTFTGADGSTNHTAVSNTTTVSANGTKGVQSTTSTIIAIQAASSLTYSTTSNLASTGCSTVPQYEYWIKLQY